MNKQIQPGSFDPIHNGHIRQTETFITKYNPDQHFIGIGYNPKKRSGAFHPYERKHFIADAIQDLDPEIAKKIHIDFVQGLIQNYCTKHSISYIRKSGRNDQDLYDETQQYYYNQRINPNIQTTVDILDPHDPLLNISSSAEKSATMLGATLLSPNTTTTVKQALEMRLNKQYCVILTGEMGSGKSYTGQQFEQLGTKRHIPTHNIDLDGLGHNILQHGPYYQSVRDQIAITFGADVMDEYGNVKRGILAQRAFANHQSIETLNTIMEQALKVEIINAVTDKEGLIIFNGAIIAEHDLGILSNYNAIHIEVDLPTQIARVLARENNETGLQKRNGKEFTIQDFEQRKQAQRTTQQKQEYFRHKQQSSRNGDNIIFNNSDPNLDEREQAFLNTVDLVDTDLSLRFDALCTRLGLTCNTKELFFTIYHHYLTNNLPYHNWKHIKDGIRQIHTHRNTMNEPDLVEMAYFFHDIIYDTHASYGVNESESAKLAEQLLQNSGLSPQQIFTIKQLILATKHEGKMYGYTHDEKYMIDIDMSIIASQAEYYLNYAQQVRQEYIHYPDTTYNQGRKQFLSKLLTRKLFYTPEYQQLEARAIENIQGELQSVAI